MSIVLYQALDSNGTTLSYTKLRVQTNSDDYAEVSNDMMVISSSNSETILNATGVATSNVIAQLITSGSNADLVVTVDSGNSFRVDGSSSHPILDVIRNDLNQHGVLVGRHGAATFLAVGGEPGEFQQGTHVFGVDGKSMMSDTLRVASTQSTYVDVDATYVEVCGSISRSTMTESFVKTDEIRGNVGSDLALTVGDGQAVSVTGGIGPLVNITRVDGGASTTQFGSASQDVVVLVGDAPSNFDPSTHKLGVNGGMAISGEINIGNAEYTGMRPVTDGYLEIVVDGMTYVFFPIAFSACRIVFSSQNQLYLFFVDGILGCVRKRKHGDHNEVVPRFAM
jgi:hypothetical protein